MHGPRPFDYRSRTNSLPSRHSREIQTGCARRRIMSAMPRRLAQRISDGRGFRLATASAGNLFQSPPRWHSITDHRPAVTLPRLQDMGLLYFITRRTVAYGQLLDGEACAGLRPPALSAAMPGPARALQPLPSLVRRRPSRGSAFLPRRATLDRRQ